MASMMAKAGWSVRPSCGIQHRQPARPTPACCAVVGPVAQQTQQSVQQRKVWPNDITRACWCRAVMSCSLWLLWKECKVAALWAYITYLIIMLGDDPLQLLWVDPPLLLCLYRPLQVPPPNVL